MGNNIVRIMQPKTNFKNLTMPTLNPTPQPTPSKGQSQKQPLFYLHPKQQKCVYQCYSFSNKQALAPEQTPTYILPPSVSILTYNIWFQQHNSQTRFECILRMLEASKADFICLQEVTQQFVGLLHGLPTSGWVGQYYTAVIPMGWYDTVILSRYACRFVKVMFQNSGMGRSMLFAELADAEGRNLVVGSMHYESLTGHEMHRQEQIQAVQQMCHKCDRVIIAGDYNFSNYGQENKVIDPVYCDLWLKIHNDHEKGYTMPKSNKFAAWRPDHVLVKVPKSVELGKAQIEKIGEFTVPPFEGQRVSDLEKDGVVRSPSDHFGLLAWIPLL